MLSRRHRVLRAINSTLCAARRARAYPLADAIFEPRQPCKRAPCRQSQRGRSSSPTLAPAARAIAPLSGLAAVTDAMRQRKFYRLIVKIGLVTSPVAEGRTEPHAPRAIAIEFAKLLHQRHVSERLALDGTGEDVISNAGQSFQKRHGGLAEWDDMLFASLHSLARNCPQRLVQIDLLPRRAANLTAPRCRQN